MKLVELRRTRGSYEVVQAARLRVGSGVAETLRRFLVETDTHPTKAVWSLPTNGCSIKFAELPSAKPPETARMARYEAETQIPVPLTDMVWGYSASKPADETNLSHTVIGSVRQSIVEASVAELEPTNLPLSGAVIASLAEARGMAGTMRQDGSALIIDVGDEWTDFTTLMNGQVTSCRSVHIGVRDLACATATEMCIGVEEAYELITQRSVLQSPSDTSNVTCLQKWLDQLAQEVRRSTLASMSGSRVQHLSSAILVGDGTALPSLDEALSIRTSLTVEIGDPWMGMALSEVAAHGEKDMSAVFAVATGLAVSGFDRTGVIDLMPKLHEESENRARKDYMLLSAMGLAVVVLSIILLYGYSGENAMSADLRELEAQVAKMKVRAASARSGLSDTTSTMARIVDDLQSKKNSPIQILEELSQGLPKSCWLTELRFEAGKAVVLRGNALSNSSVADAVQLLSDGTRFQKVELDYSNLTRGADSPLASQSQSYDFQIKCTLPPGVSLVQPTARTKVLRTKSGVQ